MTYNEIIRALGQCVNRGKGMIHCENCPYYNTFCCEEHLLVDSTILINRQKAEIERLNYENLQMIASIKDLRAEAIKEFAERLKEKLGNTDLAIRFIDNLVKEMVGDDK